MAGGGISLTPSPQTTTGIYFFSFLSLRATDTSAAFPERVNGPRGVIPRRFPQQPTPNSSRLVERGEEREGAKFFPIHFLLPAAAAFPGATKIIQHSFSPSPTKGTPSFVKEMRKKRRKRRGWRRWVAAAADDFPLFQQCLMWVALFCSPSLLGALKSYCSKCLSKRPQVHLASRNSDGNTSRRKIFYHANCVKRYCTVQLIRHSL